MKGLMMAFLGLLFTFNCEASSQITHTYAADNTWASAILIDDSEGVTSLDANALFNLMNVAVSGDLSTGGQAKIISEDHVRLVCAVPAIAQPSGNSFSSCRIRLTAGRDAVISNINQSATYRLSGEAAAALFSQFSSPGSVDWTSFDGSVHIESDANSFFLELTGR